MLTFFIFLVLYHLFFLDGWCVFDNSRPLPASRRLLWPFYFCFQNLVFMHLTFKSSRNFIFVFIYPTVHSLWKTLNKLLEVQKICFTPNVCLISTINFNIYLFLSYSPSLIRILFMFPCLAVFASVPKLWMYFYFTLNLHSSSIRLPVTPWKIFLLSLLTSVC